MVQVPLIDIGPFLNGALKEKQAVDKEFDEAYQKMGF